jgi:hypothetical protein
MATNETILKADLAVTDLETNGGKLTDEQAATFVREMLEQPTLLRSVRTVGMSGPSRQINKIGIGSRMLIGGTEATALTSGQRTSPATTQVTLTTKELIAEVRLSYDVIEDNIERGNALAGGGAGTGGAKAGGLQDTILALIAERAAVDLEDLAINGDTTSADDLLKVNDGYLELLSDAVTAGNSQEVDETTDANSFDLTTGKSALIAMPDKYVRNRPAMRHFVSVDQEVHFRSVLGGRATALGDTNVNNSGPVFAYGVPVEATALMPVGNGIFCDPLNLIFGIQRNVTMEFDKDISARQFIIVLTVRAAFAIEKTDACVLIKGLATPT